MHESTLIEQLFKQPTLDFIEHLNIENNERIIFSGRFGIGKTTFLQKFFFEERTKNLFYKRAKDYNVIHIFPVNYSIAQNEDIFRYIKYDILLEMMSRGIHVESIDLQYAQTIPFFIRDNALEIGASILKMIPLIGKEIGEFAGGVKELIGKFMEYHREVKSQASNEDLLVDFIHQIESGQGSIYEQDIITNVIEQELGNLKKEDNDGKALKENLLIIDDLDRIDPEHIFRILNVFAAHFDRPNKTKVGNKFAFDKIVLVCDIANIRQIFKAKFGMHVDFNGYIDKFYSQRIFEFNPYGELYDVVTKRVSDIRVSSHFNLRRLGDHGHYPFLQNILGLLVASKEIDLRNVFKLQHSHLKMDNSYHIDRSEFPPYLSQIIWQLKVLCLLKGDYLSLIDSIDRSLGWQKKWPVQDLEQYIAALTCIQNHPIYWDNSNGHDVSALVRGWKLIFTRDPENHFAPFKLQIGLNGSEKEEFDYGKLLQGVLIDAIKFLRREGFLI